MSNPIASSRRGFLQLSGVAALGLTLQACGGSTPKKATEATVPAEEPVDDPESALVRLIEGNQRFVDNKTLPINESPERRAKLVKRQKPFATILSCVDSRVPPELIFDRGLGDLLVVRSSGEVVDNAVLGSLEYAAGDLEVPLLLVLGHTSCDAIRATIDAIDTNQPAIGEVNFIIEALKPAVAKAKLPKPKAKVVKKATTTTTAAAADTKTTEAKAADKGAASTTTTTTEPKSAADVLIDDSAQANVELMVERLKTAPVIGDRIKKNWLLVVGGVYDLASGKVDITVGMPDSVKALLDAAMTAATDTKTTNKATAEKTTAAEKTTTTKA